MTDNIRGLPPLKELLEQANDPGEQADLFYSYTNGFLLPAEKSWELIPKRYRQSWGVKK